MKIYISGITGTGMGPLALMARAAGYEVYGSDLVRGAIYDELIQAGVKVKIGEQDGEFLKKNAKNLEWFIHTSAVDSTHKEVQLARELGIKCTKRDDFTVHLIRDLGLKLVAVAGTHGKTTTTAMIVWAARQLKIPSSYIVGTTLGFAPSGAYHAGDKYFIYEADEYDRNFLKFEPLIAVITTVSYDHPDIYKTSGEYREAFAQFAAQSGRVIAGDAEELIDADHRDAEPPEFMPADFKLAGQARRMDAALAARAIMQMAKGSERQIDPTRLIEVLNNFPGVGRRFEKLTDGIYTDYAHHPEEIAATIEMAAEQAKLEGRRGVVVVYQPHQNIRQFEVRKGYKEAFLNADKILWLPTYLTRENPDLPILTPEDLIKYLDNAEKAEAVELADGLFERMLKYRDDGYLVLLMTAGPADGWLREKLAGAAKTSEEK